MPALAGPRCLVVADDRILRLLASAPTYHPIVIRRLLTRYRRGNPVQSIWLGALLASPVWVNTLVYRPTFSTGTLLLLGGSLVGGYVIARTFLGSVSADLEEVRAQNLWLPRSGHSAPTRPSPRTR